MLLRSWVAVVLSFAVVWFPASQATAQTKETLCVLIFPLEASAFSNRVFLNPKIIGRDDLQYFSDYKGDFATAVLSAKAEAEDGFVAEHIFTTELMIDVKSGVVLDYRKLDHWNMPTDKFKELFGDSHKLSCKVLAVGLG